jgi:hypothetical protein
VSGEISAVLQRDIYAVAAPGGAVAVTIEERTGPLTPGATPPR